jgi:hypothetical protein
VTGGDVAGPAATVREAMRAALRESALGARELSQRLGIRERDVAPHLAHVERSLRASGERLAIEPAACLACGFAFARRERHSRPGRCPQCRATRITPPRFRIEPAL